MRYERTQRQKLSDAPYTVYGEEGGREAAANAIWRRKEDRKKLKVTNECIAVGEKKEGNLF